MEPWGTPQARGATEEEASPVITEYVLFHKYDLNQSKAVPLRPFHSESE